MDDTLAAESGMVAEIVARVGKIPPPAADADFFEAGFQSIDALELLLELEGAFGVTIPDEAFVTCRSVSALAALVRRLREAPTG